MEDFFLFAQPGVLKTLKNRNYTGIFIKGMRKESP
jgi:hypothetical protein